MLIADKKEQKKRTAAKSAAILNWLASERFVDLAIAARLIQSSKSNASKALSRLVKQGLVQSQSVQVGLGTGKFWVLTTQGMASLIQPEDAETLDRFSRYEPTRVVDTTVMHGLACQHLRLTLESQGWRQWQSDTELHAKQLKKTPDAMAVDRNGHRVCIEVERSYKTRKRYQQILADYLSMIQQGHADRVQYFCLNSGMTASLQAIFRSIDSVQVNGRLVKVEPAWLTRFSFTTQEV